ncbi:MAG: hypothetical protein GF346_06840 [Candidatus Eisenbacteria bacterium]|nr:hypothetical protein [Candidatus Latescibacterota bacterium]MBD3302145.1 hypothetical protein [Candidatus Eisenbacteria bacterium]
MFGSVAWHGTGYSVRAMNAERHRLSLRVPLLRWGALVCLLALVTGGCSQDDPLAPERTWEELRYHWTGTGEDAVSGDIVVRADGAIDLVLRGERASTRGLLAGENLETLARLIDALPPAGYSGTADCEESFFLSVDTADERRAYSGGPCDPSLPDPVRALSGEMQRWVEEDWARRPETVAFRILTEGSSSRVARAGVRIVDDRDGLVRLIDAIGSDDPVLVPSVDFDREIVVTLFLGEQRAASASVTVDGAHRTEGGQVVLTERRVVPGEGCAASPRPTRPYTVVAVEASRGDDLLIETETVVAPCEPGGDAP